MLLAQRFLNSKRSSFWILIISIVGIILGISILLVIMSIMNGSQLIFYENSQEILSYHIQIECGNNLDEVLAFTDKLKEKISLITVAHPYFETQGMLVNQRGKQLFVLFRGVSPNLLEEDPKLNKLITIYDGEFSLLDENSVVVGSHASAVLGAYASTTLSLYSLTKSDGELYTPVESDIVVSGVYETDWRVGVDSILVFLPISTYEKIASGVNYKIGIKLPNSHNDHKVISQINKIGLPENWEIKGWRDYNKAFFGALRMEKSVMLLLVFLILVVFAINSYNGLVRLIFEKQQEFAILRALGATPFEIRVTILFVGMIIAFVGTIIGSIVGMLITMNLDHIYHFVIQISEFFIFKFKPDAIDYYAFNYGSFTPPTLMLSDLITVSVASITISFFSAFFASIKIGKMRPTEVLRDE